MRNSERLLNWQLVTVTREILPLYPSGQFSAIASSPMLKLQFEIWMSFAGPSKCNPSVLTPVLLNTHPEMLTLPTLESRMW